MLFRSLSSSLQMVLFVCLVFVWCHSSYQVFFSFWCSNSFNSLDSRTSEMSCLRSPVELGSRSIPIIGEVEILSHVTPQIYSSFMFNYVYVYARGWHYSLFQLTYRNCRNIFQLKTLFENNTRLFPPRTRIGCVKWGRSFCCAKWVKKWSTFHCSAQNLVQRINT